MSIRCWFGWHDWYCSWCWVFKKCVRVHMQCKRCPIVKVHETKNVAILPQVLQAPKQSDRTGKLILNTITIRELQN